MALKVSPQASSDIRVAATWWRANRPNAPSLFRLELRRAFDLLEANPKLGALGDGAAGTRGIRRLYLRGTRYFIYYSVHGSDLEVLRVWHSSRGHGPAL